MISPAITRYLTLTSLGLFLFIATTIGAQQLQKNKTDDKTTARLITQMVEQYHISQGSIDDNISSKMLDRYIEEWDPQKNYFLKSDIEQWENYRKQLDDLIKQGDVSFAFEVFKHFVKRLDERVEYAHKLIDQEYDFTTNEEIDSDPDLIPWANDLEQMNERWRKRIKYELLLQKISDKTMEEAREAIHKKYRSFALLMHQYDREEVMEVFLSSLTHCFDPHSSYMSPKTMKDFEITMSLSLEGIGAQLRSEDGYTIVAEIISGGAADKDKRLTPGDKITAVGQETGDMVDIVNMKLTNVVQLIRGKPGSKVRLKVETESGEVKTYELTRQKIELNSSAVQGKIVDLKDKNGVETKIGIVNIPSFYRDFSQANTGRRDFRSTAFDVNKVLTDFRKKGVNAVIVDLRWNGGGALSEAIDVSGLFINEGPVVQIKQPNGRVRTHDDELPGVAWAGPLVVVCNRLSASASEIFAGVIKDYERGIIVGDTTTHGKGTVQNVMPVSKQMFQIFKQADDRGALKLTIQQFYRVNGESTQNRGVVSDIVLPSKLDHRDLGESFLDNALPFDKIPAAKFADTDMVTSNMVNELKKRSKERILSNKDFIKLDKQIKQFIAYKDRKSIPLNEKLLRAEIKPKDGIDISKDEEELVDNLRNSKKDDIFVDNYYNKELLNITLDLLEVAKDSKTAAR